MRVADEFGYDLVIDHGTEGFLIADLIAERGVPVLIGPLLTSRSKVELRNRSLANAGRLAAAGVEISIITDHPVVPVHFLVHQATLAVKEGLDPEVALRALTINPAKVLGVADEGDLAAILDHSVVADQLLIDAKAPKGAVLPGGNGVAFDWRLIAGRRWLRPWMLAGGLTPGNVAEAIRLTGATQVDVASGVESAPGQKDPARIAAFVAAAEAAAPKPPRPAFVMPA